MVGPPGIGKTRLTQEFAALVEVAGGRVIRGRSVPYGGSAGYRAFAQQVMKVAGIFDTDSAEEARTKLDILVSRLVQDDEAVEIAEDVALLIGLGTSGTQADRLSLFFSARRFVEHLAIEQPVLFVFEDIHWADASQLDLLESLASRVRDVPTMLLALTRPELRDTRPGWGAGLNHHTAMELHPLNPDEAKSLAARLFPALAEMPGAVEHVAVLAEGNPLFIEELAASLAERVDKAMPLYGVHHAGAESPRIRSSPPVEATRLARIATYA